MSENKKRVSLVSHRLAACAIALVALLLSLGAAAAQPQQQTPSEQAVWKLEHDYWRYVKALDLKKYRQLFHPDCLGWPATSAQPQGTAHATDWLQAHIAKGELLSYSKLEPAASQTIGEVVITCYQVTALWTAKGGSREPQNFRITHTWLRTPGGWKIISGMSAPVPQPSY